jgi:flagellar hook assembly protein FlgD
VRTVALGAPSPGTHAWTWNGLDDSGRRAPAGVYRVRIMGPSGGMSRPFVLLR